MAVKNEVYPHAEGFLVSEANGQRSRESVTLLTPPVSLPGTVLGKITASGKYVILAPGAADGSEVAAAILLPELELSAVDVDAAVIVRDAEVNTDELVYPGGITGPQIVTALAQLATSGIIGRAGAATIEIGTP